jgi:hypothetical protein
MLKEICYFVGGEWPTLVFSLIASILSLFTITGCDYVRLNFASINDANRYFKDPSYFGLGFANLQNFDENKNSYKWELNSTCYSYDDLSLEMFGSSSLKSAFTPATAATVLSIIVIIVAIVTKWFKNKGCYPLRVLNIILSLISAILQIVALQIAFSTNSGGVCDPSTYGDNWYVKYDKFEYLKLRYMKFFSECTLGKTGEIALVCIVFQFITTVWMCLNYCLKKKEISSMDSAGADEMNKSDDKVDIYHQDRDVFLPQKDPPTPPPKEIDIEKGNIQPALSEELKPPAEEMIPLTKEDSNVENGDEVEKVENSEEADNVEKDDEVEIVEKDDEIENVEKDDEIDNVKKNDEIENVESGEEDDLPPLVERKMVVDEGGEEEDVSLYTTDVRKEGEATVGSVKIASMKSGRF